jgi:hypothetical protein
MILLIGDQLVGPGALLADLLFVKSSPPQYFTLLIGSRLHPSMLSPLPNGSPAPHHFSGHQCSKQPDRFEVFTMEDTIQEGALSTFEENPFPDKQPISSPPRLQPQIHINIIPESPTSKKRKPIPKLLHAREHQAIRHHLLQRQLQRQPPKTKSLTQKQKPHSPLRSHLILLLSIVRSLLCPMETSKCGSIFSKIVDTSQSISQLGRNQKVVGYL